MKPEARTPVFTLRPEARASKCHFLKRHLFHTPPAITIADADLTGKTAIITGGNSGLGLETARHLLDLGGRVILAVRDEAKGQAAVDNLVHGRQLAPDMIQVWPLDMSNYQSILAFAEKAKSLCTLDIVILNAAVIKAAEQFGSSGYEESFQTNYLSTALVLLLLLPIVKEKRSSGSTGRFAITSSDWASWAKFDGGGPGAILPQFKKPRQPWDGMNTYGIGKLFNQLFVWELVKRVSSSDVVITHPDPGMNNSNLGRGASGITLLVLKIATALLARDPSVGSRTLVHSVTTLGATAQGHCVEDENIEPLAPVLYTAEGQRLAERLYEETLDELSFAKVRELVGGTASDKQSDSELVSAGKSPATDDGRLDRFVTIVKTS
ncbi:hypothetical protein NLU13_3174 [Sarocladium strictum]|uniref:Uncharacterized protein n=1 Tax=Sarocladium strictum TaxID=5046 RepID=A0AA39LA68_SARSR|nr:hypothetical protein NLU13_3174 [Sarocladium strictum]